MELQEKLIKKFKEEESASNKLVGSNLPEQSSKKSDTTVTTKKADASTNENAVAAEDSNDPKYAHCMAHIKRGNFTAQSFYPYVFN